MDKKYFHPYSKSLVVESKRGKPDQRPLYIQAMISIACCKAVLTPVQLFHIWLGCVFTPLHMRTFNSSPYLTIFNYVAQKSLIWPSVIKMEIHYVKRAAVTWELMKPCDDLLSCFVSKETWNHALEPLERVLASRAVAFLGKWYACIIAYGFQRTRGLSQRSLCIQGFRTSLKNILAEHLREFQIHAFAAP